MPLSSLPSEYGIGNLGKEARKFIDFLENAGQTYWQLLPLGPTSYGDSPYASPSTFAGNPYFIDLDELIENGMLTEGDLSGIEWARSLTKWITDGSIRTGSGSSGKHMTIQKAVFQESLRNFAGRMPPG